MLHLRTILHPSDFSDRSQYALSLATALARDHGARVVLLHVVTPPIIAYGEGVIPVDPAMTLDEARADLEQLTIPGEGVQVDRRVEDGDPADAILRVAEEEGADLIVMGTHGRTGLSRLLMGSVAEQVVRRAECPVLTLKSPFAEAETPDITVAQMAETVGAV